MSPDHALTLIQMFVRALSHRIRTPLSVVTNDLHYLSSFAPPGECTKSQERCREIAKILSETTVLGSAPIALAPVRLGDFFGRPELTPHYQFDSSGNQLSVVVDPERWLLVFRELPRLLLTTPQSAIVFSVSANASAERVVLRIAVAHATPIVQPHDSFSSYFCGELGRDSFIAPLLDIALMACGVSATIAPGRAGEWSLRLDGKRSI